MNVTVAPGVIVETASPSRASASLSRIAARYGGAVIAGCAALLVLLISSHLRSTPFNNYVRLADAMLHGHLWIDWPGTWMDAVAYHGRHYGVDAPMPAVLLIPWVLLFGSTANQTFVAIGVTAISVVLAWEMATRAGVARWPKIALVAFFFAGTDLWWTAELGDVWFLAHDCAVCFTLLALLELCGKRRGWLVALWSVCAFESRFTLALAVPVYAYMLWSGRGLELGGDVAEPAAARGDVRGFVAVLALATVGWAGYNQAMWGTWNDIGHTLYFHQDPYGQKTGSPFSFAYLPYQLYSFFFRAPLFVEWLQRVQWPYVKADNAGIALTFTSPALLLAFRVRAPRRTLVVLWAATLLVAAPNFFYYLNGWYQFGMRHALDFEPFLFVLMALAVRKRMPAWGFALCAYSAGVGTWGVWYWNTFMRTGN